MKKIIAVVGDSTIEPNGDKYKLAHELGRALVDAGYRVQTGGRSGIMEAVFVGAQTSKKYTGNDTIAISPFFDRASANPHADIVIATGLDIYRNTIVANADAVVAIGGGAGTLCEISNAWTMGRMVIGYQNVDGWSAKLAGSPVDHRHRYETIPDDMVYPAKTADDVIKHLATRMPLYNIPYKGLWGKE